MPVLKTQDLSLLIPPNRETWASTWYWPNAAPREEWKSDFETIQDLGFTHVILCWGLDASASA